jgi:hypothetical protein
MHYSRRHRHPMHEADDDGSDFGIKGIRGDRSETQITQDAYPGISATQTPLCRRRFHGATWKTWKATAAAAQLAAALFRRDCRRSPVTNLSKSGLGPPPPVRAKVQTCGGIGTTEDQSHSAADRQPNTIDAQAIITLSVFRAARLAALPLATYQALNGGRGLNLRYGVSFDSGSLLVGDRRRHSP